MTSFLVIIIFYFLLFLEGVTEEQAAYEKFDADLTKVLLSLKDLRYEIHAPPKNAAFGETDKRIDELIGCVESAIISLKPKSQQGIEKGIRITSVANKIRNSIDPVLTSSDALTPDKLKGLLGEIETIWNDHIEAEVKKAIK
jgi:hypothetical protein